jgi:Tfp pilus assembly protein PilO
VTIGVVVAVLLVALLVAAMAWAWYEADKADAIDLDPFR